MAAQLPLLDRPLPAPHCELSLCMRYRYSLTIPISQRGPTVLFILANPSTAIVTAGELKSDRTVTRCIGYGKAWGYGTVIIANIRAWRETDPRKVPPDPEAIGPRNADVLRELADRSDLVVCGWGDLGGTLGWVALDLIRHAGKVPHALKLNADGAPAHPLYLRADLKPLPMTAAGLEPDVEGE